MHPPPPPRGYECCRGGFSTPLTGMIAVLLMMMKMIINAVPVNNRYMAVPVVEIKHTIFGLFLLQVILCFLVSIKNLYITVF